MPRPLTQILVGLAVLIAGFVVIFYLYNGVISIGERGDTRVPDLVGKSVQEARELVERNALSFSVARSEFNETVPKDSVISQDPDGGMRVKKGRPVQVVVSNGPQLVQVPDLKGLDRRDAELEISNSKLRLGKAQYAAHAVAKKDVVVDQDPLPGASVQRNASVNLSLSSGPPPPIRMPTLVGHDLTEAKTVLQQSKLRLGQVAWKMESERAAGTVLTQNPEAGGKVHEGDMASLVVSAGESAETLPFKQSYITIQLPAFGGEQEVTVWITDETSTNLAYRGVHRSREKIELLVSGYGNSKVEVYLASKILSSGQL